MSPDITKYTHYLDGLEMPDSQKEAFLEALWGFGERVMDLVWGTDATQLALGLPPTDHSQEPEDAIHFIYNLQENFSAAVEEPPARRGMP